ncbi:MULTISPECIES: ABC transporter ATP-binding protein [Gemella]|uniref:ABC transporter ATP-binding protein n=1 Tax=Gemella TaxID=1378 RepID=UPI000768269B|nr:MULTISPECIES: ABC transporter ATP-binding protein [Gemella]AME09186.1 ABC transporter ATP-binding protein [Gemella sp. oral taxon 928]AXI26819.1 ABC transporter ATP-binding protein [Gemella sp. ND 6198]
MLNVYKKILYYVPKERYLVYLGILFSIFSVISTISAYYYFNEFLNKLVIDNNISDSKYYAFVIVGFLVGSSILYGISGIITHVLGFRLETNLRKYGINGLSNASFSFFDTHSSGKTRKIIDDNAEQTHMIVAHLIPDNARAILTPILILILGFIVNWKVGVSLVVLCLVSGLALSLMMGEKNFMDIYQKSLERLSSETVEYVRGIQVIKIFGINVLSFKALHNAIKDYSKYALDYSMSCKRGYVGFQLFFYGFIAIIIPIVIFFIDMSDPRQLTVELIMILFLSGVLFVSIMGIMYVSMYAYLGTSVVEKLENIFNEMQSNKLSFGDKEEFKNFDIEFENVNFGYNEKLILNNLSFKLEENKSYAFVGSSGSGKSTIAKLISGFYKISSGAVKIGGENIESYKEEALIKNISFVFQSVKLFKNSIYENVKLGRDDATYEEVMEALHLAGCDTILDKFKDRENTIIGTKGVYLSGGEKQRIAIARAILKDAKIIIMDEASAAVDPDNEYELQRAFANLIKDKTVIMIAHRLSSIRNVDEILVVDNGKIIERGSDKELMSIDSSYKEFQRVYGQANEWRVSHEK